MRIRKVNAHAFGPLEGEELEFADGLTVVVGDNESAKSSWHAAIYAALCGRRRGKGRARKEEQPFIDRHQPWDGGGWRVSAEVLLDDDRRIELSQDLAGKVDCHAKDLDIGEDVSDQVMNDGAPDGARWLGLDRTSFLTTACVEQTQLLRVLDGATGLQSYLESAASTAGADATSAAALDAIENFRRERVGTNKATAVKPLRRALDEVRRSEQRLAAARQTHEEYLALARRSDELRLAAERADAEVLAHEAARAAAVAAQVADDSKRAAELREAIGDTAPAAAKEDDALAQQVTEALTSWRDRPTLPDLTGRTAAELQSEIDALPNSPDGDREVHASVAEALSALRSAEDRLAQLEADQPLAPVAGTAVPEVSDRELSDFALVLEAPAAVVDPGLEAAEAAARDGLESARSRARSTTMIFTVAGVVVGAAVALLATSNVAVGAVALVAALALVVVGVVRRRSSSVPGAQRRHAEASAKLSAAREQVGQSRRRREEVIQRCGQLGLTPDPNALRQVIEDRARTASYRNDLTRWEQRRAELRDTVASASSGLRDALSVRGQQATASEPTALAAAVEAYRRTCEQRSEIERQARQREPLTVELKARQQREQRAEQDRQAQDRAAARMAEAASACRLPVGSPEDTAAALEKWLTQRAERMAEADQARRQAAELEALLNGRTLDELAREAETASAKAASLAAQADQDLLATIDPGTVADRIPALRHDARDAHARSGEASGELRQFAASVTSVAEAEEALEAAEATLHHVRELEATLDCTREFLEGAQKKVHRDIAPLLKATLKESLPSITAGRYTDVTVNPSTLEIQVRGSSGRWRRAEHLSHGTAEQIYLLLRIALVEHLTKNHDTCPLILDDVTVHADAARKEEIMALLLKIAEQRQVILFTQEQQIAEWAREHLSSPGHAIRTLEALSVS